MNDKSKLEKADEKSAYFDGVNVTNLERLREEFFDLLHVRMGAEVIERLRTYLGKIKSFHIAQDLTTHDDFMTCGQLILELLKYSPSTPVCFAIDSEGNGFKGVDSLSEAYFENEHVYGHLELSSYGDAIKFVIIDPIS